jgi:hypothetical protein
MPTIGILAVGGHVPRYRLSDISILHQWWKSQGEDLRKALGGG